MKLTVSKPLCALRVGNLFTLDFDAFRHELGAESCGGVFAISDPNNKYTNTDTQ
jgi:hypothetical protein